MPRKITTSYVPDVYFGTQREEFRVEGTHPWARGHSTREAAEKQAAELDAKDKAEAEGRH